MWKKTATGRYLENVNVQNSVDFIMVTNFITYYNMLFFFNIVLIIFLILNLFIKGYNMQWACALEALCDYALYKSTLTLHYIYNESEWPCCMLMCHSILGDILFVGENTVTLIWTPSTHFALHRTRNDPWIDATQDEDQLRDWLWSVDPKFTSWNLALA